MDPILKTTIFPGLLRHGVNKDKESDLMGHVHVGEHVRFSGYFPCIL